MKLVTSPPQAYVFLVGQSTSTSAVFNGLFGDVRAWILEKLTPENYDEYVLYTGDKCQFKWTLPRFLEMTKSQEFVEELFLGKGKDPDEKVNHPSHYNRGNIEVIEAIEDWKLGFNLGNTVKYVARASHKDPQREIEDLEKALWYLTREINRLREAK